MLRCKYDDPLTVQRERQAKRDQAILEAFRAGGLSYRDIAKRFGVSDTTIGRIVRRSRT